LISPSIFHIEQNHTNIYTAIYTPICPTTITTANTNTDAVVQNGNKSIDVGGSGGAKPYECGYVFFSSMVFGEFCYKLDLTCEESAPVTLRQMEGMLGDASLELVQVENTLKKAFKLNAWSSNPTVFMIFPLSPVLQRMLREKEGKEKKGRKEKGRRRGEKETKEEREE
jgi:hypothetical protein